MKIMSTIKIESLKLGIDVIIGDFIRMSPTACSLTRIDNESQLESFKNQYSNLEITIDRNQPWFSVFTVPSWNDKIKAMEKGIVKQLNEWN